MTDQQKIRKWVLSGAMHPVALIRPLVASFRTFPDDPWDWKHDYRRAVLTQCQRVFGTLPLRYRARLTSRVLHELCENPLSEQELLLKFLRGKKVRIPKGTTIQTTHPQRGPDFVAGRTYEITVHHVAEEWRCEGKTHPARVVWPGTGGYWCEADAKNVELIEEEA